MSDVLNPAEAGRYVLEIGNVTSKGGSSLLPHEQSNRLKDRKRRVKCFIVIWFPMEL